MNVMSKDPRIKQLAREAAAEIKTLTVAHESQITAIYQQFRQKAAQIQESNADSLVGSNVTPIQPTEIDRSNKKL